MPELTCRGKYTVAKGESSLHLTVGIAMANRWTSPGSDILIGNNHGGPPTNHRVIVARVSEVDRLLDDAVEEDHSN